MSVPIGLVITRSALRNLEKIPQKIRIQLIKKVRALVEIPFPPGAKKMVGTRTKDGDSIWRERSGNYRILYVVRKSPDEIIVLDIDSRKDVYR